MRSRCREQHMVNEPQTQILKTVKDLIIQYFTVALSKIRYHGTTQTRRN